MADLKALASEAMGVAIDPRTHRCPSRTLAQVLGTLAAKRPDRRRARRAPGASRSESHLSRAQTPRTSTRRFGAEAGAGTSAAYEHGYRHLDRGEPFRADEVGDRAERPQLGPRGRWHLKADRGCRNPRSRRCDQDTGIRSVKLGDDVAPGVPLVKLHPHRPARFQRSQSCVERADQDLGRRSAGNYVDQGGTRTRLRGGLRHGPES